MLPENALSVLRLVATQLRASRLVVQELLAATRKVEESDKTPSFREALEELESDIHDAWIDAVEAKFDFFEE